MPRKFKSLFKLIYPLFILQVVNHCLCTDVYVFLLELIKRIEKKRRTRAPGTRPRGMGLPQRASQTPPRARVSASRCRLGGGIRSTPALPSRPPGPRTATAVASSSPSRRRHPSARRAAPAAAAGGRGSRCSAPLPPPRTAAGPTTRARVVARVARPQNTPTHPHTPQPHS